MASLNKIFIIGNLTKDPELRYTRSGIAVASLSLATNRQYKDKSGEQKKEVCFIKAVAWDKRAEICNQYLHKGSSVFVEGRLQSRNWETPEGQKRSTLEIVVENVQFLGKKEDSSAKEGVKEEYTDSMVKDEQLTQREANEEAVWGEKE